MEWVLHTPPRNQPTTSCCVTISPSSRHVELCVRLPVAVALSSPRSCITLASKYICVRSLMPGAAVVRIPPQTRGSAPLFRRVQTASVATNVVIAVNTACWAPVRSLSLFVCSVSVMKPTMPVRVRVRAGFIERVCCVHPNPPDAQPIWLCATESGAKPNPVHNQS